MNAKQRSILTRLFLLDLTTPLARRFRVLKRPKKTGTSRQSDITDLTPEKALARIEALDPDSAWAVYVTLSTPVKELIAHHVSTKRWASYSPGRSRPGFWRRKRSPPGGCTPTTSSSSASLAGANYFFVRKI